MISKSILHRLFVIRAESIYHFYPKSYFLFLKSNWSSNEQLVCGPTTKPNPSRANERVGPIVQDLESVFKRTTSLLSLKAGRSDFYLAPYVPSYSLNLTLEMGGFLSRRTRATFTHAYLRIILNKHEFIVSSGLRSSYLYSLHRTPPLTCLHMYNLVITLFISYTKVGRIHSVPSLIPVL